MCAGLVVTRNIMIAALRYSRVSVSDNCFKVHCSSVSILVEFVYKLTLVFGTRLIMIRYILKLFATGSR